MTDKQITNWEDSCSVAFATGESIVCKANVIEVVFDPSFTALFGRARMASQSDLELITKALDNRMRTKLTFSTHGSIEAVIVSTRSAHGLISTPEVADIIGVEFHDESEYGYFFYFVRVGQPPQQ